MQAVNTGNVEHVANNSYDSIKKPNAVKDGSSFLSIIEKMLAVAKDGNVLNGTEKNAKNVLSATAKEEAACGLGKLLKAEKKPLHVSQDLQKDLGKKSALNLLHLGNAKDFLQNYGENDLAKNSSLQEFSSIKDVSFLDELAENLLKEENLTENFLIQENLEEENLNVSETLGFQKVKRTSKKESDDKTKNEELLSSSVAVLQQEKGSVNLEITGANAASRVSSQKKLPLNERIKVVDERTTFGDKQLAGSNSNLQNVDSSEVTMSIGSKESFASKLNLLADKKGQQGSMFSRILSQEIQESMGQIVQQGTIILKDFNQGTIRLTLNPEHLGNVKIQLKLSENNVTGSILVASEDAMSAFKENLDGLKTAFMQTGFETAGFELGYENAGKNHSENQKKEQKTDFTLTDNFNVESKRAKQDAVNAYEIQSRGVLNIVA